MRKLVYLALISIFVLCACGSGGDGGEREITYDAWAPSSVWAKYGYEPAEPVGFEVTGVEIPSEPSITFSWKGMDDPAYGAWMGGFSLPTCIEDGDIDYPTDPTKAIGYYCVYDNNGAEFVVTFFWAGEPATYDGIDFEMYDTMLIIAPNE